MRTPLLALAAVLAGVSALSLFRALDAPAFAADGPSLGRDTTVVWNGRRVRLTPMQFYVTRRDGTEPPFRNAYNDNDRAGLYVDVITGEPLFLSTDKFDSGTGWPSFTRPVASSAVRLVPDRRIGALEVRSARGDNHLGHVFDDGPRPTGQRYCMNSAAMRFIPAARLEAEGYGPFAARLSRR